MTRRRVANHEEIGWWLAMLLVLSMVLMLSAGCSTDLFRLRKEGPPPVPKQPEPTYRHEMTIRELADWSARMLRKVESEGAPRAAPVVAQAAEAAETVSGDVGPPAEPLPLPPARMWEPSERVEESLTTARSERDDYERDAWQWQRNLEKYELKSVRREWAFGVPLLAGLAGLVVIAWGVTVAIRYGLKWKMALWETFLGVRDFFEDHPKAKDEAGAKLAISLSVRQNDQTKAAIDGFQARVGD